MLQISVNELQIGDRFYDAKFSERTGFFHPESAGRIKEVKELILCSPRSGKLHINGNLCYDGSAQVFRV